VRYDLVHAGTPRLARIIRGQAAPKAGLDAAAGQANRILDEARKSR
jgi:hypothetical protein